MSDLPSRETMLDDLLALESGLSAWEMDFLDSLAERDLDRLSDRQAEILEELWLDHC